MKLRMYPRKYPQVGAAGVGTPDWSIQTVLATRPSGPHPGKASTKRYIRPYAGIDVIDLKDIDQRPGGTQWPASPSATSTSP